MKARRFIILTVLLLCSACAYKGVEMTDQDYKVLAEMRKHPAKRESFSSPLLYDLIYDDPVKAAKTAINNNDYALISLAMGYMSSEEDADIFGVACDQKVDTKPLVFGCMGPPEVLFKQMLKYNLTILDDENFPHKQICHSQLSTE